MRRNIFLLGIFIVACIGVWGCGGSLWSYAGGFVGTFLILLASGWRMYATVQQALRSEESIELAHVAMQKHWQDDDNNEQETPQENNPQTQASDQNTPKQGRFFGLKSGIGLSFAPLRLISYGIFIVITLALIKHNELEIVSFLLGNALAIIEAVVFLKGRIN